MSIVEIAKGKYKVRYRVGTKQYAKSGFSSKKEARTWEAEQLRRIRSGNWTDPQAGSITIAALFHDWLTHKSVSHRTKTDYMEVWASCIQDTWGHVRVKDAMPSEVSRWLGELQSRYSAARVRKALTVLSQVFDWAVADQRVHENPVKRARALSAGPLIHGAAEIKAKRYLSHEEVVALMEAAPRDGDMILVMAYTGLRFGEVSALQGRDVDLLRARLKVERAHADVRGRLEVVPPKSGKARAVPIPQLLRSVLEARLAHMDAPSDLLFTAPKGGPVRYSRWRRDVFNPAVREAGLVGLTPHGLRHTYAALAVQAGANPKVLQAAMGHSDIRLTLDTYGGLFGDDLDGLAQGLDSAASRATRLPDVPELFPRRFEFGDSQDRQLGKGTAAQ